MFHRSTPEKYLLFNHALSLYKLFWSTESSSDWVALNFNQVLTTRQTSFIRGPFIMAKNNRKKVGLNELANRMYILNNRIPLSL